jgi:hypothetical protein
MTAARLLLIALACGSACVEAAETTDASSHDRTLSDDGAAAAGELTLEDDPGICDLLPTCGPCSLICDPEALAESLPVGTCVALICTLTNGTDVTVHACNVQ